MFMAFRRGFSDRESIYTCDANSNVFVRFAERKGSKRPPAHRELTKTIAWLDTELNFIAFQTVKRGKHVNGVG